MKKTIFIIAIALCSCLSVFSQATSLTVDCQNPGWLSSKINYGDQLTLKNIKVTGYINGTDLQFILDLNKKRSLTGVIDLENVSLVSGGTLEDYPYKVEKDNVLPYQLFSGGRRIQKLVLPNTLLSAIGAGGIGISGDSIIWTSLNEKDIMVSYEIGSDFDYIFIPEGIEGISNIPDNTRIVFPSTINNANFGNGKSTNLTIYSFIENPENINAQYETYYSDGIQGYRQYWAAYSNSTFYIPKGTMENYLKSDFAVMYSYKHENMNYTSIPNGNVFIEYYDIENTVVKSPEVMYKGESANLDVQIYPDANLVSWIDYSTSNPDIVSVDSEGKIVANGYGQVEISATPHVFIDGLETKTGTCIVKVIAHTEGIEMASAMSVHIGEEKALNAKTLPLDMSDDKITYKSSDTSIAKVTEDGTVIGNKRGTCTITATSVDGGYTAECEVTVTQPVEALSLEKHSLSLKVGDTESMYAQIAPLTADDKTLNWYSRDEEVATVDESGNVSALKAGETWIVAVSNDNAEAKDSCKVTVQQPVNGITLNHNTYTMNHIGDSFELEATVQPDDASNKNIKWKSSNESVCVVSNGTVIAVGDGTCVIIATTEDGGYMATCTVTVTVATGVSFVEINDDQPFQIYDVNGMKRTSFKKGINIIRFVDGTMKKVQIK
ncbi:MAG: Ig-like domain-containing protein [Prevotella sp.]|nr:Ig-like domain-containing protein [Prevotella sp.]